ncbi:hypothetical protein AB0D54_25665 [Streptomyces xanthophaeus]
MPATTSPADPYRYGLRLLPAKGVPGWAGQASGIDFAGSSAR